MGGWVVVLRLGVRGHSTHLGGSCPPPPLNTDLADYTGLWEVGWLGSVVGGLSSGFSGFGPETKDPLGSLSESMFHFVSINALRDIREANQFYRVL